MSARIDTSHIRSPRDPMTAAEREAVRQELRETSDAIARIEAEHGSVRDELSLLYGDPWDDQGETNTA